MFFKNISQGFIWTIKSRCKFISTAKFLSKKNGQKKSALIQQFLVLISLNIYIYFF